MAISAGMVWEVRQTGSDANGGGFRGGAALATPSAPGVTGSTTGGTVAAGTYYVVVTSSDGNGETPKSAQASVTTTGATSSITVTSPANPNVQGSTWNVYVGTASGGPYFSQGTGLAFGANRSITATPPTTGTQAPGVDYSQQDAAQVTYTDLVIGNPTTTNLTSAGNPFTPAHVGNVLNVTSGTGFTVQRLEVTGVTAAGVATVDKAAGTAGSTAGVGKLGGAFASPAMPGGLAVSGNVVYLKYSATAYTCSATNNVSGGSYSNSNNVTVAGYDTTRTIDGADANRPALDAGAASMTVFAQTGVSTTTNLIATNSAARASVTGLNVNGRGSNLRATGATAVGINGNSGLILINCLVSGGTPTTAGFQSNSTKYIGCVASGVAGTGFNSNSGGSVFVGCFAVNCTGNNPGFNAASSPNYFVNCVSYGHSGGSGAHGFSGGNQQHHYVNCAAYGNTGNGFSLGSGGLVSRLTSCAAGANTQGNLNSLWAAAAITGFITLTADPFTNAAGLDFGLNGTAGGGALLRAAGYPSSFPGLATTSYPDVGASQHRSPGRAR